MKEYPILFSGAMVRAILEGRKTQTRRVIKPQPRLVDSWWEWPIPGRRVTPGSCIGWKGGSSGPVGHLFPYCPYGYPGSRLWIREKFCYSPTGHIHYAATDQALGPWKPSIHMPRFASRITLEITWLRAERLQDISEEDAIAEGVESIDNERDEHDWKICPNCGGTRLYVSGGLDGATFDTDCQECDTHKKRFRYLWDSINKARGFGWDTNPWVWVIEFRKVEG